MNMTAIRKTRKSVKAKKKVKFLNFAIGVTLCTGIVFLFCSLFLRSYNNELSTRAQEISSQIAVLETQNDAVRIDIQTLGNYNRVEEIAAADGMSMNPNNIITISAGSSSTDGE